MRGKIVCIPLFFIFFVFILPVSVSSASVSYFEITPENPVKGDVVKIEGKASPTEQVPVKLSFEKDLNVVEEKYNWKLSSVEIPEDENRFSVTATNVENLNVALKIGLWWGKGTDAENGVAKISQSNVPAGTHDAKISGKSGSNEVNIKVEAEAFLTADDATGNFEYTYDSSSIPAGEFVVTVGGITKTIELLETRPTPTPSSGGGGGGSAPDLTPTPTPTPTTTITENVTLNETPTPTPQTISINKNEAGVKAQILQNKTNQSPQKTPEPVLTPGFELAGCMAALIIILWLKRGRRRRK
jgi:hypothetical protein